MFVYYVLCVTVLQSEAQVSIQCKIFELKIK